MPSSSTPAPLCPFKNLKGALCGNKCKAGHIGCSSHKDEPKKNADRDRLRAAEKWASADASSDSDDDDKKKKKVSKAKSSSFLSFPAQEPPAKKEKQRADDFSDIPKLLRQDGWNVKVLASSSADLDRVYEWLCHEITANVSKAAAKEWKRKTIATGLQTLGVQDVTFC